MRAVRLNLYFFLALAIVSSGIAALGASPSQQQAAEILRAAGIQGGLVVHLGCGDADLTTALAVSEAYLVQGLDADPQKVASARRKFQTQGVYGRISIDSYDGRRLPYAENLVNLLVVEQLGGVTHQEAMRVLAPGGVLCLKRDGRWAATAKPWPKDIDVWTHYLHDASGNAVAADRQVGPPKHLRWLAEPRWSRSHEFNCSISAVVTSGGRLFYIVDEGITGVPDVRLPSRWALVARDAFSGVLLWKVPMPTWGAREWNTVGLWSTPLTLPRRLVTDGQRVFVTLGYKAPLTVLDAATGRTLRTLPETEGTDEILLADGVLLACVRDRLSVASPPAEDAAAPAKTKGKAKAAVRPSRNPHEFDLGAPGPATIMALDASSGRTLWKCPPETVTILTLAVCGPRACYHDGERIVCLDLKTGKRQWATDCRGPKGPRLAGGTLVLHGDVVLFTGTDGIVGLSAKTGEKLWSGPKSNGPGVSHPADLFVADNLVWGGATGAYDVAATLIHREGRDPVTGQVKRTIDVPYLISPLHHFRCYRTKATERFLLLGKRGVEFLDLEGDQHMRHDWLRAPCSYGFLPANGILYMPPSPCFCYPGVKLTGFNALAAKAEPAPGSPGERLEKGPAYTDASNPHDPAAHGARIPNPSDWPTYRHDPQRSGCAGSAVPAKLSPAWQARLGGKITPPVVAGGRLLVAQVDAHAVHCLDAASGKPQWTFTAGGRIDSAPTIHEGSVLFGCCDGWVYCLHASDGALAWRFRVAPDERKIVVRSQVESVWPSHGSLLVLDGTVYCTAGRSSYLDGGIHVYGLDARTGQLRHETLVEGPLPDVSKEPGRPFDMEGSNSDILVTDGEHIYLYQIEFDRGLKRVEEPRISKLGDRKAGLHLISTSGLLDDTWFDRTYWAYWRRWPGFYFAINAPKTGAILVFDNDATYALQVFTKRARLSPTFTPGTGYRLVADANDNEPDLAANSIDKEKGPGFSRQAPPRWSVTVPVRAQAMLVAGKTLFLAGPPDEVPDSDPYAAFDGRLGAKLWAVSTADGSKLSEYTLKALPLVDGMAAAGGRLYLATQGGEVLCFGAP